MTGGTVPGAAAGSIAPAWAMRHAQWSAAWTSLLQFERDGTTSAVDWGGCHPTGDAGFDFEDDDGEEGVVETYALMVIGRPGTGKTWLLNAFRRQGHLRCDLGGDHVDVRPIVRINIPDAPSPKSIVTEIATKLGATIPKRWTRNEVSRHLRDLFSDLGVRFILMDEAHVLVEDLSSAKVRLLARFLKFMLVECRVPIILAGEEPLARLLTHPALKRRTTAPVRFRSYGWGSTEESGEFIAMVGMVAERLGWANWTDFDDVDLAARIYFESEGVMGLLINLMREASKAARRAGADDLRKEHLAAVFDAWHPFRPGIADDPFAIGSLTDQRDAANPFLCGVEAFKGMWRIKFRAGPVEDTSDVSKRRKAPKEQFTALKSFGS